MRKFKHYGVEVVHQYIDGYRQFENFLESKNAEYRYLPVSPGNDVRNNVLVYTLDGVKKYALLIGSSCIITTEIPEDGDWYNLYCDVRDQMDGEEPYQMKSKVKVILELAEQKAVEDIRRAAKTEMEKLMSLLPQDPEPWNVKMYLSAMGYNIEELLKMDHNDVDEEWLCTIKNSKMKSEDKNEEV